MTSGIGFESGFGTVVVVGAAGAAVVPAVARSRGGMAVDADVVGEAIGTDREVVALGTRCDCGCAAALDGGGVAGGCVFLNDDVDDDVDDDEGGSGDRVGGAAAGGTAGAGVGDAAGAGVDDVPIGSPAVVVGAVLAFEGAVLALEGASAIGGPRPSAGADDFVRSESSVTGSVK